MSFRTPFLYEYRSAGQPASENERVLAVGRAFLTVTGLGAIYLDPTEPTRFQEVTYGVLLAYALYSLAVLAYVHGGVRLTTRHAYVLHGVDILWTSVLTFVSEGPVSPFFLFFLFVVLAAAYRWGLRETIATALLTFVVFLAETAVVAAGAWNAVWLEPMTFELNRTIIRGAYLLLTGVLLGYLARQQKESRAELAAIADVMRQPGVSAGVGGSVAAVARRLLSMFRAASVAVVIHDRESRRLWLWEIERRGVDATPLVRRLKLDSGQQPVWLFPEPGRAWHAIAAPNRAHTALASVPGAWPLVRREIELPAAFVASRRHRTVTAVGLELPDEWQGRVYLFDVAIMGPLARRLHFLEALAEHVSPVLTNVLLLRRLRARVGAEERARVARELHDGAIQALMGIEMKMEAIRRKLSPADVPLESELAGIQGLLRGEVQALRELMQALRPLELDSGDLREVLAGLVERFRRETGISARFLASGRSVALPPARALEIVRIVQEALVNARKHSQAKNVLVRLAADDGDCSLIVEDDGCGFAFEGRFSAADLAARRLGPAMIRERARLADAQLAIESSRGAGSRVELTFRQAPRA